MRLVLDTNVLLSGLVWQGTPSRLLRVISNDKNLRLLMSSTLLDELADVLTRDKLRKKLLSIEQSAEKLLGDLKGIVEMVAVTIVERVITADPDDDQVLAAALAGQANLIVSGDKRHLLALGSYRGIAIVSPAAALERSTALSSPPP